MKKSHKNNWKIAGKLLENIVSWLLESPGRMECQLWNISWQS